MATEYTASWLCSTQQYDELTEVTETNCHRLLVCSVPGSIQWWHEYQDIPHIQYQSLSRKDSLANLLSVTYVVLCTAHILKMVSVSESS